MKKNLLYILLILFIVVSCKEEAIPRPNNLLSKERMAGILYDITMINSIKGVNKFKLEESYMRLDTYLYEKHKTDSIQFQISNNYYAANPTVYSEIYEMVQARLTKERKVIGEELEAEQKRRDSIQEAKKIDRENGKKDSVGKIKFSDKKVLKK
ncbi:MAG: DUF4296 domain-containing protein [Bacteroidota bacterium]